jgi:predicted amidohydrolase
MNRIPAPLISSLMMVILRVTQFSFPVRQLYGHTAVADPWGAIIAMVEEGEGLAIAELSRSRLEDIRRALPLR